MYQQATALAAQLEAALASASIEDVQGITSRLWAEGARSWSADSALSSLLAAGKTMLWDIAYEEPEEEAQASEWQTYESALLRTLEAVLCLFEGAQVASTPVIPDAGAQLLPLIEDMIDLTSSRSWHTLFAFIETRRKRLTKGMLPNRGKSLTLLRTLNTLLRLLPRVDSSAYDGASSTEVPSDLELRARIHLFMASAYAITDQSGTNQRGDYAPLGRAWGCALDGEKQRGEAEGDVDMDKPEGEVKDETVFHAIAGLQRYFAQPGLLATPAASADAPPAVGMADFRTKSDLVLARLFDETKRGHVAASDGEVAVGATNPELVELQLADPTYRRRLLTQFLIFLQTLQQLNPDDKRHPRIPQFPATFTISPEDLTWAKSTFVSIRDEFSRMDEHGDTFDRLLGRVVGNDRHHAIWKSLNAYAFEQEPMDTAWLDQAERQAQLNLLAPAKPYQWSAGTRALTEMAKDPLKNVSQLRHAGLEVTLDQLKQEYDEQEQQEAEEAQTKMEVDENDKSTAPLPPQVENKASLSWRALRLVMSDHLPVFEHVPKGDLPKLYAVMNGLEQPQAPAANGTAQTASKGSDSRAASQPSAGAETPKAEEVEPAKAEDVAMDVA